MIKVSIQLTIIPFLAMTPILLIALDDYFLAQYFFAFALVWLSFYIYSARRAYLNLISNQVSIFKSKPLVFALITGFIPIIIYGTSYEVVSTPQPHDPVVVENFAMNQSEDNTVTISGSCDFDPRISDGPKPFSFSSSILNIHKTADVETPMIAQVYQYHHRVYPLISYSTPYQGKIYGYVVYLPG